jgi:outer membrane protein OmpA-like peptidoglycan-associated protein
MKQIIVPEFVRVCVLIGALLGLPAGIAVVASEPGSKDHPLLGRYEGSEISYYKSAEYDEAAVLRSAYDAMAELDGRSAGAEWLKLEGRVTQIRYAIPTGRSSLEVLRNYEAVLKERGFATVFACADKACFTGKLDDPYLMGQKIDATNGLSTAYFDHARYVLAGASIPGGTVYVALLVGEEKYSTTAFVQVIETKPLETGKMKIVSSSEMGAALQRDSKIDLYGILFDFDRAEIKPESQPVLQQIAALLQQSPELRLEIVGHTDNTGSEPYNLDLSGRRAASVVSALAGGFSIDPGRLTSSGAGMSMPIAPNDTEDGRAQNRRVELRAVR